MNKFLSIILVIICLLISFSQNNSFAQSKNSKILLIDKMTSWDGLDYVRLMEIAAQNGIELNLATGYKANPKILDGSYKGIIVFGGGGGHNEDSYGGTTGEQLVDLQTFTKNGGRFVFFPLPRIAKFNDELRNLYRISTGSEFMTPFGKSVLAISGGQLTPLWEGIEVGSKKSYKKNLSLQTYFASLSPDQSYTSFANQEGEKRKVSIYNTIKKGEYLFISSFSTGGGGISYRNIGNILHDGNISAWDNEIAAEKLILWLVGRLAYPK